MLKVGPSPFGLAKTVETGTNSKMAGVWDSGLCDLLYMNGYSISLRRNIPTPASKPETNNPRDVGSGTLVTGVSVTSS